LWSDAPAGGARAAAPRPLQWMPLEQTVRGVETPARRSEEDKADRARAEAERVLEAARAQGAAIVAAAEAERGSVLERARRAGLEQGQAEGRAQAEAEHAALLREARRERNHARSERRMLLHSLVADIAGLAMDIARRVLDRELEQSPEEVVGLARRLLHRVHGSARALVHPTFAPVLEAEAAAAGSPLTVLPDPSVSPGGLILETDDGLLDATLASRLRRVESAVRGDPGHGG